MKKLLFATLLIIAATMTSCTNKVEEALDGVWETSWTDIDEDGDEWQFLETLNLNADTHEFQRLVSQNIEFGGETLDMGSYTIKGTWKADEDCIELIFDESDIKIDFSPNALMVAGGRDAIISEIMKEAQNYALNSYSKTEFSIPFDDGEECVYHRKL